MLIVAAKAKLGILTRAELKTMFLQSGRTLMDQGGRSYSVFQNLTLTEYLVS